MMKGMYVSPIPYSNLTLSLSRLRSSTRFVMSTSSHVEQWAAVWRDFTMFSAIFLRMLVRGFRSDSRAPAAANAAVGIGFNGFGCGAASGARPGAPDGAMAGADAATLRASR